MKRKPILTTSAAISLLACAAIYAMALRSRMYGGDVWVSQLSGGSYSLASQDGSIRFRLAQGWAGPANANSVLSTEHRFAGFEYARGWCPGDPAASGGVRRLTWRSWTIPYWFAVLLATLIPARTISRYARSKRQRRIERGLCPNCTYNLTGNTSGVCPECGVMIPAVRAARGKG